MLDRHPGERLIAEVTEHNIATNIGAFLDAVAILRSRGVLIAIDDAGTGYASLQQILQVGPDIIKLDRALVSDVDSDPLKRALASAFVTFAGEAKTMLIAEGVETVSELHALQDLGVAFAQGYVCAPPLLVDELRPA
jgi:EAL domain-containing protein (putative c-di-GMP-specific phosphodiesterase class I)